MYGSETDHPRYRGTHIVGHALRSYEERGKGNFVDYGTPLGVIEARFGTRAAIAEGLEEWKAGDPDDLWYEAGECSDEITLVAAYVEEPLAEWERVLLDEPEVEAVEESADAPDDHWIPVMSYGQALSEIGSFVIDGGPATPLPPKRDYYLRVHELARYLEVDSASLVRTLCLAGEYVASAQSWVALPVAKAMLAVNG